MPAVPITIGELTDVPTFNSPIASPWAQEATQRIVHRFANSATRDAQYTARLTGALAYSIDTRRLCMWDGSGWVILRELPTAVGAGSPFLTVWPHSEGAASTPIGVAGTWASTTTVEARYSRYSGVCDFVIRFTIGSGGVTVGQFHIPFSPQAIEPFDNQFAVSLYSSGAGYAPGWSMNGGGQTVWLMTVGVAGTGLNRVSITPTFPFTWKAGDQVNIAGRYTMLNPYDAFYMNP